MNFLQMRGWLSVGLLSVWVLVSAALVHAAPTPRREIVEQFEVQMRTLNYEQALKTAQQLLDMALAAQPTRVQDVVAAHAYVGRAYVGLENAAAAETSFTKALQLAEQQLGPSDRRLVDPLVNLGLLYARTQRHDEAVRTLERALILSRRNAGLYDIEQTLVLKQLGESYTALGAIFDAQRHMDYLLSVAQHSYGTRDLRAVPIVCDVAEWYSRTGDGPTARVLYRKAIAIAESRRGKNAVELVMPLQGLARTYTRELTIPPRASDARDRENPSFGFGSPTSSFPDDDDLRTAGPQGLNSEGQEALERALKILEAHPDRAAETRHALIVLGDWYQIKQDEKKALSQYTRASVLANATDMALLESGDSLQTPLMIYYPVPPGAIRFLHRPADELEAHYVLAEFTVTARGEVEKPTVVDTDATERHVKQTLAALERARFRPRFVDGEPVATTGIRYRQVFKTPKKTEEKEEKRAG